MNKRLSRETLPSVEAEKPGGHLANFGKRADHGPVKAEMRGPEVFDRMKKTNQPARWKKDRAEVAAFGEVAREAGESQVCRRGAPAVLAGDDVVHLMREESTALMDETAFAEAGRARNDAPPKSRRDRGAHAARVVGERVPAAAFARRITCSS